MGIFSKAEAHHQGDLVDQKKAEDEMEMDYGELEPLKSVAISQMHELPTEDCIGVLEGLLKMRPIITRFVWFFTEDYKSEKKVKLPGLKGLLHRPRKEIATTLYNLFAMDDTVVGVDWEPGREFITLWIGTRDEAPVSHVEVASQPYY